MPLTDYRCHSRLRVRWAEIDMQRIVFNAHYLTYYDTAITEYFRAIAFDLAVLRAYVDTRFPRFRFGIGPGTLLQCHRDGHGALLHRGEDGSFGKGTEPQDAKADGRVITHGMDLSAER